MKNTKKTMSKYIYTTIFVIGLFLAGGAISQAEFVGPTSPNATPTVTNTGIQSWGTVTSFDANQVKPGTGNLVPSIPIPSTLTVLKSNTANSVGTAPKGILSFIPIPGLPNYPLGQAITAYGKLFADMSGVVGGTNQVLSLKSQRIVLKLLAGFDATGVNFLTNKPYLGFWYQVDSTPSALDYWATAFFGKTILNKLVVGTANGSALLNRYQTNTSYSGGTLTDLDLAGTTNIGLGDFCLIKRSETCPMGSYLSGLVPDDLLNPSQHYPAYRFTDVYYGHDSNGWPFNPTAPGAGIPEASRFLWDGANQQNQDGYSLFQEYSNVCTFFDPSLSPTFIGACTPPANKIVLRPDHTNYTGPWPNYTVVWPTWNGTVGMPPANIIPNANMPVGVSATPRSTTYYSQYDPTVYGQIGGSGWEYASGTFYDSNASVNYPDNLVNVGYNYAIHYEHKQPVTGDLWHPTTMEGFHADFCLAAPAIRNETFHVKYEITVPSFVYHYNNAGNYWTAPNTALPANTGKTLVIPEQTFLLEKDVYIIAGKNCSMTGYNSMNFGGVGTNDWQANSFLTSPITQYVTDSLSAINADRAANGETYMLVEKDVKNMLAQNIQKGFLGTPLAHAYMNNPNPPTWADELALNFHNGWRVKTQCITPISGSSYISRATNQVKNWETGATATNTVAKEKLNSVNFGNCSPITSGNAAIQTAPSGGGGSV